MILFLGAFCISMTGIMEAGRHKDNIGWLSVIIFLMIATANISAVVVEKYQKLK
jgi:hypothetical protein